MDEAPTLDEAWFAEARPMSEVLPKAAHKAFKTGRPKATVVKKQVTLRLDADLLDMFKATGRGWQTRINTALRAQAKRGVASGNYKTMTATASGIPSADKRVTASTKGSKGGSHKARA
ncbi:MAG TPA: BrnA antitoxin family protein [Caulobacteraceae bacterium]|nr:BrnA antitoxin family protein [Caulobacteraceae bacterium]